MFLVPAIVSFMETGNFENNASPISVDPRMVRLSGSRLVTMFFSKK